MSAVQADGLKLGWRWLSVAEIAAEEPFSITDGPFGSNLKTEHYTPSGPRVVRLTNIGDGEFIDAKAHISPSHFERLQKHRVEAGDLLIAALGDTLPRACIAPPDLGPAIVKADCIRVRVKPVHSASYLRYALISPVTRRRVAQIIHGVGRPRLNLKEIKAIEVPVAPPDEQRSVVAEIETQFSRLDAAVAALKRAQVNLKRCRASILKAACEGRLVPTEAELARQEGRSYETGAELLARHPSCPGPRLGRRTSARERSTAERLGLPRLPEGWIYCAVEDIGTVQLGRQRAPKHHTGADMRPYLRVANVYEDRLDLTDIKWMNFTDAEFETYRLQSNDILLNEGQSLELVGRPALYNEEVADACFQNTLVRFRPSARVVPRYALTAFRAYMYAGYFQRIARWTTNIAHLGCDRFAGMPFPLPPLTEQERIVAEVERRLSALEATEKAVTAGLQRAARLRQAVLARAFSGEE